LRERGDELQILRASQPRVHDRTNGVEDVEVLALAHNVYIVARYGSQLKRTGVLMFSKLIEELNAPVELLREMLTELQNIECELREFVKRKPAAEVSEFGATTYTQCVCPGCALCWHATTPSKVTRVEYSVGNVHHVRIFVSFENVHTVVHDVNECLNRRKSEVKP